MFNNANSKRVVRVRLIGGLGNQLFQYFAGLNLSLRNSAALELDFRWIDRGFGHPNSDIRDFLTPGYEVSSGSLTVFKERVKSRIAKSSSIFQRIFKIQDSHYSGYLALPTEFDFIELRANYQTLTYYNEISNYLPRHFWEPKSYLNDFGIAAEDIPEEFIAVHIRGGDYLESKAYEILNEDYYIKGIEKLRQSFSELPVVIFTDDYVYASNLIGARFDLTFFDDSSLRASQTFFIMHRAKALIISNSTFSFWAAVASNSQHVIAPRKWYRGKEIEPDFYPEFWELT